MPLCIPYKKYLRIFVKTVINDKFNFSNNYFHSFIDVTTNRLFANVDLVKGGRLTPDCSPVLVPRIFANTQSQRRLKYGMSLSDVVIHIQLSNTVHFLSTV